MDIVNEMQKQLPQQEVFLVQKLCCFDPIGTSRPFQYGDDSSFLGVEGANSAVDCLRLFAQRDHAERVAHESAHLYASKRRQRQEQQQKAHSFASVSVQTVLLPREISKAQNNASAYAFLVKDTNGNGVSAFFWIRSAWATIVPSDDSSLSGVQNIDTKATIENTEGTNNCKWYAQVVSTRGVIGGSGIPCARPSWNSAAFHSSGIYIGMDPDSDSEQEQDTATTIESYDRIFVSRSPSASRAAASERAMALSSSVLFAAHRSQVWGASCLHAIVGVPIGIHGVLNTTSSNNLLEDWPDSASWMHTDTLAEHKATTVDLSIRRRMKTETATATLAVTEGMVAVGRKRGSGIIVDNSNNKRCAPDSTPAAVQNIIPLQQFQQRSNNNSTLVRSVTVEDNSEMLAMEDRMNL